jgi:hypothetical protein
MKALHHDLENDRLRDHRRAGVQSILEIFEFGESLLLSFLVGAVEEPPKIFALGE